MENTIDQTTNLHPIIENRFSPRAFADRSIDPSLMDTLLDAARRAPSCFHEQPWRFLYAYKGEEAYEKLYSCLLEGNQIWAGKAPVLLLSLAKKTFTYNGKPNRHAWHDTGMAIENLALQGIHSEIYIHQMAGFKPAMAIELFDIPDDFEPVAMVALGYLGDPQTLPEKLRETEQKPKKRKSVGEIAFHGTFNEPTNQ